MKNLIVIIFLFCANLGFGQTIQTPPTISLNYIPYEMAFQIKKAIRDKYDSKLQTAAGTDAVLLQSIESQIATNGTNAQIRTYTITNIDMEYYVPLVQKYANQNYITAQKAIAEYNKIFPILQSIKRQNPTLLQQIFESNSSVKYADILPYLPQ